MSVVERSYWYNEMAYAQYSLIIKNSFCGTQFFLLKKTMVTVLHDTFILCTFAAELGYLKDQI